MLKKAYKSIKIKLMDKNVEKYSKNKKKVVFFKRKDRAFIFYIKNNFLKKGGRNLF